jgi:hypothetical protein
MSQRALIFAGAGASKAVNSQQFPTTVEFFKNLPDEIKKDSVFQFVENYLRLRDQEKIIDIEEILWELQRLRDFIDDAESGENLLGFALSEDRLIHLIYNKAHNSGHLWNALPNCRDRCETLIGRINETVYDFYNYEPAADELASNWVALFEFLSENDILADVFTTNYDLSIESAVALSHFESYDEFVGLSGRVQKRLDLTKWTNATSEAMRLTKLHGSINWQKGGETVFVGASLYTGDHKRHAIIYPGFKGEPEATVFGPFHSYLVKRLSEADFALFIGFAFRDEYINQLIADNINDRCMIKIINPDKRVKFPLRRRSVEYVPSGFGLKSLGQALTGIKRKARAI